MKAIKGLLLFCFLGGLSSCFDPPEFDLKPEIKFNQLVFVGSPSDPSDEEKLTISIDFKDGDGDIGLNAQSLEHSSNPFHNRNFYLGDGTGKLNPIGFRRVLVTSPTLPDTLRLLTIGEQTGKIVTLKSRNKPSYGFLPPYLRDCSNRSSSSYDIDPFIVAAADNIIDNTNFKIDSLTDQNGAKYYVCADTLFFKRNENHYNIIVKFFQKNGNTFEEFKWEDPALCETFNGRLTVLSDNSTPLSGTIKYDMKSSGFNALFSIKTLKLRIILKDRALNLDSLDTPEFKLADIRIN